MTLSWYLTKTFIIDLSFFFKSWLYDPAEQEIHVSSVELSHTLRGKQLFYSVSVSGLIKTVGMTSELPPVSPSLCGSPSN